MLSADSVIVFIDFNSDFEGKEYISPKAYRRLENKDDNFTFENGDIIVKGIVDFDLNGVKPNTLKYLEEYFDDVYKVISIMECELTGNWEVGGVS